MRVREILFELFIDLKKKMRMEMRRKEMTMLYKVFNGK